MIIDGVHGIAPSQTVAVEVAFFGLAWIGSEIGVVTRVLVDA